MILCDFKMDVIKVAEHSFSITQLLVNIIWKLRTSEYPKLAWCKIN